MNEKDPLLWTDSSANFSDPPPKFIKSKRFGQWTIKENTLEHFIRYCLCIDSVILIALMFEFLIHLAVYSFLKPSISTKDLFSEKWPLLLLSFVILKMILNCGINLIMGLVLFQLFGITKALKETALSLQFQIKALGQLIKIAFVFTVFVNGALGFGYETTSLVKFAKNYDLMFESILNYKNNAKLKMAMDRIQFEHQCCGYENFSDWFTAPWIKDDFFNKVIDPKYINKAKSNPRRFLKNNTYVGHDVPFSCCNKSFSGQCHFYNVDNSLRVHNTDMTVTMTDSIYRKGCKDKVNSYFNNLFIALTSTQIVIILLKMALLLFLRLIQTALYSKFICGRNKLHVKIL